MDTTFGDLKQRIIRLVGDDPVIPGSGSDAMIAGAQTPAELLRDGIYAALDAICTRSPKTKTWAITNARQFDLPSDLIEVDGVYSNNQAVFLPEFQLMAYEGGYNNASNAWDIYEDGKLTLHTALSSSENATVYYSASWLKPIADSEQLEPPAYVETALALYAAHYVLFYDATQSGKLGQYKTKVDSGTPIDNPLIELVNFFLKHYEIELQRIPMKTKGRKS